jgi:hypothetical protein
MRCVDQKLHQYSLGKRIAYRLTSAATMLLPVVEAVLRLEHGT